MPRKLRQLLLLPDAEEDLKQIYDPLFTEIVQKLKLLRQFPELGARISPPFESWRSFPVGQFLIIYRIVPRGIEIAYVRHGMRQSPLHKAQQ